MKDRVLLYIAGKTEDFEGSCPAGTVRGEKFYLGVSIGVETFKRMGGEHEVLSQLKTVVRKALNDFLQQASKPGNETGEINAGKLL